MSEVYIKLMNEDAVRVAKKQANRIFDKISTMNNNSWINDFFKDFTPLFIEKKYTICDFNLKRNPSVKDKKIDYENSIIIYNSLKKLPRFILCDERFWLWLEFDKFYDVSRDYIKLSSGNTFLNHWTNYQGKRRGIFFGVFSRMYFRVFLSIDYDNKEDIYHLTKWIIDNPERIRNLTWRSYSSEEHIVRGALKGEKRFCEEYSENVYLYPVLAKEISLLGSVKLLDNMTEKEIEDFTYNKLIELSNRS